MLSKFNDNNPMPYDEPDEYLIENFSMKREYETILSNGYPANGIWVLRKDGEVIDYDRYRIDLAQLHGFTL
jgi:hypothetical protein